MKSHQKRHTVPKNWPIPRKGSTFVVKGISKGVPILIILRDMLKLARNRKEVKKAIHLKHLSIFNNPVSDEKLGVQLFDVLKIIPSKKFYRLVLSERGKYSLEEISEKESSKKIAKILGKKILKGKKSQINLGDGRNYLSDLKCDVNDSVIIDFKGNKIEKILPLKEKSEILVIGGKHAGLKGTILKLIPNLKMVEVEANKNKVRVLIKQLMIIG